MNILYLFNLVPFLTFLTGIQQVHVSRVHRKYDILSFIVKIIYVYTYSKFKKVHKNKSAFKITDSNGFFFNITTFI